MTLRYAAPFHIGIVGGGYSGSMLAVHLLREAKNVAITLIEGAPRLGRGIAYSTDNPDHLLNVRAEDMSAFADEPDHFVRWLQAAHSGHAPDAFVPRRIYGDYISAIFAEAAASPAVTLIRQPAVALQAGARPGVMLGDGQHMSFDRLALCLGNFAPGDPPGLTARARNADHYLLDPWQWAETGRIGKSDEVLIVGTGLTMIDAVQSLTRNGHTGRIVAVSRRGLLPARHVPKRSYDVALPHGSLLAMLREARRDIRVAEENGHGWRAVIDAFRAQARPLWQRLSLHDRRQFLRHLRPYWEVRRHRIAPQIAHQIAALRRDGRLHILAGRLNAIDWTEGRFDVGLTVRGSGAARHFKPHWIINCTGPQSDYGRIDDPLVKDALRQGIVRPDALRISLDVTAENAVIDRTGRASTTIVAVGPPTKGAFWEVTAVPDIRGECARVAKALVASTHVVSARA